MDRRHSDANHNRDRHGGTVAFAKGGTRHDRVPGRWIGRRIEPLFRTGGNYFNAVALGCPSPSLADNICSFDGSIMHRDAVRQCPWQAHTIKTRGGVGDGLQKGSTDCSA